jgi:hypothetical protein
VEFLEVTPQERRLFLVVGPGARQNPVGILDEATPVLLAMADLGDELVERLASYSPPWGL